MNWEVARQLEADGLITIRKHPEVDLFILNYTPKCQYEGIWTQDTMQCRGLIVDADFNIKARPFKKFFNLEQHANPELPDLNWNQPYSIMEKMDGSLGILYWMGEYGKSEPRIATRGSFTSDQAVKATEMLRKVPFLYTSMFDEGYTYLFEIIYPQNRIVVDYQKEEKLVLLAVVNTATGEEVEQLFTEYFGIPTVYPSSTPESKLRELVPDDGSTEGLVVRFADGTRVKVKTGEYVRLHKLLTQFSTKDIWEFLREGKPLDELLDRVPDEFYDWVKATKTDLELKHEARMRLATELVESVEGMSRKGAAELILAQENRSIGAAAFSLLDGKTEQAEQAIWKAIKPEYSRPFTTDPDL